MQCFHMIKCDLTKHQPCYMSARHPGREHILAHICLLSRHSHLSAVATGLCTAAAGIAFDKRSWVCRGSFHTVHVCHPRGCAASRHKCSSLPMSKIPQMIMLRHASRYILNNYWSKVLWSASLESLQKRAEQGTIHALRDSLHAATCRCACRLLIMDYEPCD